jgi:phage terminase large subunit
MDLNPDLTPKQWVLYDYFNNESISEILYWWSWRCGKTWWVAEIVNLTCIAYPKIVRGVGRREWDDLRKTSLNTILKVLRHHKMEKGTHFEINMQTKELTYYNGSKIHFIPLKVQPHDREFNWLWWYELTFWRVDEAQEVDRKAIDIMKTRMTEMVAEYDLHPKILMTCNPMKCHLYSDFIKPDKEGTITQDRVFIPASYKDNPHIDQEKYEKQYENADEVTKQRILFGNWEYDDTPWKLFEYDKILDLKHNPWVRWKKYITCDPARHWDDKAIIRVWDGFVEIDKAVWDKCDATQIEDKIREFSSRYVVPMSQVIVDEDGMGWPMVDHLRCKGFLNNWKAINGENYRNLKTQCYFLLAKYVNEWYFSIPTCNESLTQELDVVVQVNQDKDWPLEIISKDDIKKKIGRSPDESDSLMMRMWFELQPQRKLLDL